MHRNDAINNIHAKPNSSVDPRITKIAFKCFLHRTHTVCLEKYTKEYKQLLVGMFFGNGYKRTFVENLAQN